MMVLTDWNKVAQIHKTRPLLELQDWVLFLIFKAPIKCNLYVVETFSGNREPCLPNHA